MRGPTDTSQENSKVYNNATVTLDQIPRYATATSAEDFTDEQNPVLVFDNPAGDLITSLQAAISTDGSFDDIAKYHNIPKTASSYTFSLNTAERSALRKAVTGSTSRTIRLYVRSKIGSSDSWHTSYVTCKVTVVNCTPSVSLSVIDTNSRTIALTGNNQVLVRYMSTAKATGSSTLKKEATLVNQTFSSGGRTISGVNTWTIENVSDSSFGYSVLDNRGQSAAVGVTKSTTNTLWIPYIKPTCVMGNNNPTIDDATSTANLTLTVTGQCYSRSFGATRNNQLNVYYRYKATTDENFGAWTKMTVDSWNTSTHRYSANSLISGLTYDDTYVVEAYAEDSFEELTRTAVVSKSITAKPVFDWGKEDFNLNVKLNMYGETILRMNTDGTYDGDTVLSAPRSAPKPASVTQ